MMRKYTFCLTSAFSLATALGLGLGCGEVTEVEPDASGTDRDASGGGEADATADSGASDAAAVSCDEGYTGENCAECTVFVHGASGDDEDSGLAWDRAVATVSAGIERAEARQNLEDVDACSVWVRRGTYVPGAERTDSFELEPGVHVYGGFNGDETAREQRDVEDNTTTLSGEISAGEHVYHVVRGADEAILDGFTITGGVADGDNNAEIVGAGMVNENASPIVQNVEFTENAADRYGGAIYNVGDSAPIVRNAIFSENAGRFGGAIYNTDQSAPRLVNAVFTANTARVPGLSARASSDYDVLQSPAHGGALYNEADSEAVVINATFSNNDAYYDGGAIYVSGSSALTLTNVSLSGNSADRGGALSSISLTSVEIVNAIFWGNTANTDGAESEIDHSGDYMSVRHSIVEGSSSGDFDDVDELDNADPQFVDAPADLRLDSGSPAIGAGDDAVTEEQDFPELDLGGNPRVVDVIDQGAYEHQP